MCSERQCVAPRTELKDEVKIYHQMLYDGIFCNFHCLCFVANFWCVGEYSYFTNSSSSLVQLHTAITVSRGFSIRMVVSHMTGVYLVRLHTLTT